MLTATERHRLSTFLRQFDCSDRETEIYLLCLGLPPSSVQEIARQLDTNRFTIHSAVERLVKKGLLCETRKGKHRLIMAENPDVLTRLLEKKKAELSALQPSVEYLTTMLRSLQSLEQSKPVVRFYEGVDGYKKMLDETLSARGEVLVFSYVPLLASIIGADYLEDYFRRRGKKKINSRLIFPRCAFADRVEKKAEEYRINIRYLPKNYVWTSGIFAWNDCISLLSYTKNNLTSTIIENPDIARFFRTVIFEMSWKGAEE